MNELEQFNNKVHGRVYNKPFYIIKHEAGEIYKISSQLLTIFNEREKYAEAKFIKKEVASDNHYTLNYLNEDWQKFLQWEVGIAEPVTVTLDPSELYFMSYHIINDKKEKYVSHIYSQG